MTGETEVMKTNENPLLEDIEMLENHLAVLRLQSLIYLEFIREKGLEEEFKARIEQLGANIELD